MPTGKWYMPTHSSGTCSLSLSLTLTTGVNWRARQVLLPARITWKVCAPQAAGTSTHGVEGYGCHQTQTILLLLCLFALPCKRTQRTTAGLLHLLALHAAKCIVGCCSKQPHHTLPAWHVQSLACICPRTAHSRTPGEAQSTFNGHNCGELCQCLHHHQVVNDYTLILWLSQGPN